MIEKEHLSQPEFDHVVQEGERCQDEDGENKAKIDAKNGSEEKLDFGVGDEKETQQAAQDAPDKNPLAEKDEFDGIEEFVPNPSGVHEVGGMPVGTPV